MDEESKQQSLTRINKAETEIKLQGFQLNYGYEIKLQLNSSVIFKYVKIINRKFKNR